jgi:hypothetical protein
MGLSKRNIYKKGTKKAAISKRFERRWEVKRSRYIENPIFSEAYHPVTDYKGINSLSPVSTDLRHFFKRIFSFFGTKQENDIHRTCSKLSLLPRVLS